MYNVRYTLYFSTFYLVFLFVNIQEGWGQEHTFSQNLKYNQTKIDQVSQKEIYIRIHSSPRSDVSQARLAHADVTAWPGLTTAEIFFWALCFIHFGYFEGTLDTLGTVSLTVHLMYACNLMVKLVEFSADLKFSMRHKYSPL